MHGGTSTLREKYDVVIVGSGPAGAATAKALTGHGLDTVIIERTQLPRYKMCSGILFPSACKHISDNFGELPKYALSKPVQVKGNRVCLSLDSPFVDAPFSIFDDGPGLGEDGVNIKRSELDYWLCRQSDASIVDRCAFRDFRQEGEEIIVNMRRADGDVELRTKYLVGADGTLSKVRKAVSEDFDRGLGLIVNYEEWYVGTIDLEPGWLYLFFDRKVTGFFACVFHKDNQIVVVTGVKQHESAKEYFKEFAKVLRERHRLAVDKKVASHACVIHDMSATNNYYPGKHNILLAGEAGGFNRCAEGITSALLTGKAAGEAILESIESGKPALESYSKAVAPEMEMCNTVNRLIEQSVGVNPFTRE